MAYPIQIILTRQLAAYLSVPLFLVDPKANLLFYNEPAEAILGSDGSPITAHTLDPVPFIWISREAQEFSTSYSGTLREGSIPDIAPTLLRLLDIPVPDEMTAPSIIPEDYFREGS